MQHTLQPPLVPSCCHFLFPASSLFSPSAAPLPPPPSLARPPPPPPRRTSGQATRPSFASHAAQTIPPPPPARRPAPRSPASRRPPPDKGDPKPCLPSAVPARCLPGEGRLLLPPSLGRVFLWLGETLPGGGGAGGGGAGGGGRGAGGMHPPLVAHKHPACAELISGLELCHAEHPLAKFWGVCNAQKIALDRCFRTEKALRSAANREKAKREKNLLQEKREWRAQRRDGAEAGA